MSLCAATVPCGRYATQMLAQDGVTIPQEKITVGQDVKATLTAGIGRRRRRRDRVRHRRPRRRGGTSPKFHPGIGERARGVPGRRSPHRRTEAGRGMDRVRALAGRSEDAYDARLPPDTRHARRDEWRVPPVAAVLATVAVLFFVLPLRRVAPGAPWSDAWDALTTDAALDAIRLSLECSLWATALSIVFGVPLAYVPRARAFPGRALVRAFVVLPMVLPPVVGGVALLYAFSVNNGLMGGWLHDTFDVQFTFSPSAWCSPRRSSPCRSSSSRWRRACVPWIGGTRTPPPASARAGGRCSAGSHCR